jgi:chemotaxis protein MotB
MEQAQLPTERISRVVGLASSVLFDRENPRSPVNRRISIVVLTQQAEQDANKTDLPATQRAAAESESSAAPAVAPVDGQPDAGVQPAAEARPAATP